MASDLVISKLLALGLSQLGPKSLDDTYDSYVMDCNIKMHSFGPMAEAPVPTIIILLLSGEIWNSISFDENFFLKIHEKSPVQTHFRLSIDGIECLTMEKIAEVMDWTMTKYSCNIIFSPCERHEPLQTIHRHKPIIDLLVPFYMALGTSIVKVRSDNYIYVYPEILLDKTFFVKETQEYCVPGTFGTNH